MTRLGNWMVEAEITDETLATAVGVDRTTISRIRRGKQEPSSALIRKIVLFAEGGLSADDLLGLTAKELAISPEPGIA